MPILPQPFPAMQQQDKKSSFGLQPRLFDPDRLEPLPSSEVKALITRIRKRLRKAQAQAETVAREGSETPWWFDK